MTTELDATRALQRELSDAQILIEQVKAISEEGDTLLADTVEGETNILELIAKVDYSIVEDDAIVVGLGEAIKMLQARKTRIEGRADMKRAVLANALDMIGKKSHETPTGKISLSPKPLIAVVIDESLIPSRFWTAQAPKLDKTALNAAVKAGEAIDGATKSNPGLTISIRR